MDEVVDELGGSGVANTEGRDTRSLDGLAGAGSDAQGLRLLG